MDRSTRRKARLSPKRVGITRRAFLGRAVGTTVALGWRPQPALGARLTRQAVRSAGSRAVLTAADFTPLGYYDVQTRGLDSPFVWGLTHRYVGGDLRFLTIQLDKKLQEFSLAGHSYGSLITTATNVWDTSGAGVWDLTGLWWEEAFKRLWTVTAIDYTNVASQVQVYTRSLNQDGTVSNLHGPVGLSGIPAKRVFGGAQPVPAWFQAQYGTGPYAVGWGGYTSLVAQGGVASLGPTMYTMPDPSRYGSNTEVTAQAFKILMDYSSGSVATDWYGRGRPTTFDRGSRLTCPTNYFDSGDPRPNPPTPPAGPPQARAGWLSPAPDGKGRFVWGDSYNNTGCWIDGPTKHGFVAIATLGMGQCWYGSSNLNWQTRVYELHIFDPGSLGEAASGARNPWGVKPSSMAQMSLSGMGGGGAGGGNPPAPNGVAGATYDPSTRRLYLLGTAGGGTYVNRLFVYAVEA
jgi:hypothetical protein